MAQGFIIWFTGLSGSGKSTLAALVSERLRQEGVHVEALDGDEVRKHLSWGLGFSREDRDRNVRRIGYVARLVSRAGSCAITAAISPFRAIREEVRSQTDRFCEVYCECPLEVLAERDPKGLYKRALAGEIKNFTGVDDPYEAPEHPEIHLRTDLTPEAECVEIIVARLTELGFLSDARDGPHLPPPYGGELIQVPIRSVADGGAVDVDLPVDLATKDLTLAIAAGFLSPVSGFMTEREAEKVQTLHHLEQGYSWPEAQLLPDAGSGAIKEGMQVRLVHAGAPLARLHTQQIFTRGEGRFVAGMLEAVEPSMALEPTARGVRGLVKERGFRSFAVVFERAGPSPDGARVAGRMAQAAGGLVLFVLATQVEAWRQHLGDEQVICLAMPAYLESRPSFDAIVGRNVGGSRVLSGILG